MRFRKTFRMKKQISGVLAITLFAAQPAFAAHVLGDAGVYTSGQTSLSGAGSYGGVAAGSFTKSGRPDYTLADLGAGELPALMDDAAALSTYYLGLASTAFSISGNVLQGVSGLNVINLTGAQLASLGSFSASDASMVVLNISGPFSASGGFFAFPELGAENVLFNFYNSGLVALSGTASLGGTVLAVDSSVQMSGSSSVGGSVFASNFAGSGNAHVGGARFEGLTPGGETPAVPEPAVWALMILGFGLVGTQLRRRRQRPALA